MSKTYFNISDKLRLYEFDGMLDQYGDAAAAYSLRKLRNGYTGDAIRVRRSSDDAERDIGFYDNELDTIALLDWVNEEILHFDADLNDPTGWLFNGSTMGAGSIDFTNSSSTTGAYKGYGAIPYEKVRVTFTIANYVSGQISWANYGGGAQDAEWKTADGTYVKERVLGNGNANWGFWTQNFTGSVTEFKVEIIGSNGHVHTWYDQSANANHAVQGTDTAQPKIVDAGTLVVSGSKPSLKFDGVDDFYQVLSNANYSQPYTLATVFNYNALKSFDFVLSGGAAQALGSDGSGNHRIYAGANLLNGTTDLTQKSHFAMYNGTASQYSVNGNNVIGDAGTNIVFTLLIGKRGGGQTAALADANISEVLVYNTDESANRENIEVSMNNHYNIY